MRGQLRLFIWALALFLILSGLFWLCLPRPLFNDPYSTVLLDRYGELLGARIADDGQWRFPPVDSLPEKYKKAAILFEDRFFYYHPGVNPLSLLRALLQNLKKGEIVSGGSTLTMQVIRLARKGKSRTIPEKIIEIVLATRLELTGSKEDILCLYASHAPFGGNVVGIDAASWRYYGRPPEQLSWAETATLAVLPNAPSLIHPGKNRSLLIQKRNLLLEKLERKGLLDSLDCELSKLEALPEKPFPLPSNTPHLMDRVYTQNRGSKVRSSLDASLQQRVNLIIEEHHKQLKHNNIHNACCLVLDTRTGEVMAYVGNTHNPGRPEFGGDVDIINAPRSTGSILKPILYCMMLEEGEILPGTLVPDIPTQYTGYSPKNFTLTYDGAVPARRALSRSLNIPAVRMLQTHGFERFYYQLEELGIHTLSYPASHYGLSLILGGAEGSLWEITGVYASMGRVLDRYNQSGQYLSDDIHPPVYAYHDKPIEHVNEGSAENIHSFSAASLWLTFQSLLDVNRPYSQAGWKSFSSSGKIAWKTGTSFGFRDGWAIGTSPAFTIGVWVGNADGEGRPGLTGIAVAAPVLFDVFNTLPRNNWFQSPVNELYPVAVCNKSGHLPGPFCPSIDTIYVPARGRASAPCPYHRIIHLSPDGMYRVNSDCRAISGMRHESWFVLPPAQEWYYRAKNPDYRILPQIHPDCKPMDDIEFMEMIYPRHSARIYVPREMDGSKGEIILEAAHRHPSSLIYWHLNETFIGTTRYIHKLGITPKKGNYLLTIVDENGYTLVHRFEIIDL
ncbi:MAG: penicillin-binding protein 1C [Bacteroidales bacterium]